MVDFGYAVGDVVAVGKLAWAVYKACVDAPASFGKISQEVIALEAVVRQFEEAFDGQVLSIIEQERLKAVGQGCQGVLEELQELVRKYERLGSNAKLSFDRFKWAAVPVDELRTRLISNTMLLSAFVQTSPVVIIRHVRKIIQEYKDGKREGSVFSSLSADSLTSDERAQWRVIRKELESSGLTLGILDNNRELIVDCLTTVLGPGPVADQHHHAPSPTKGKGKQRLDDSPRSGGQGRIANPFTDSAFELSEKQKAIEGKDILNTDLVGQSESKGSKLVAIAARELGKSEIQTQLQPLHTRKFVLSALRSFLSGSNRDLEKAVQGSKNTDQAIETEKASLDRNTKVLLLGTAEAGKSTLLKQMHSFFAIHDSIDMRKNVREIIFSNIVVASKLVIYEMRVRGIGFATMESKEAAQIVESIPKIGPDDDFPPKCYAAIRTLETDEGFQLTLHHGHEFALHDNFTYYLDQLPRIMKSDYIPSRRDILRSSAWTRNPTNTIFHDDQRKSQFHVIDVGGVRAERKKWVYAFKSVRILIFVAPISVYNRSLIEDKSSNAMTESLKLFESILSLPWFKRTKIVLVLNKVDQLRDTLGQHPVQDYFPDYSGDPLSERDIIQFFTDKFLSYKVYKEQQIVVELVDLIDTKSVHRFLREEIFIPR